MLDTRLRFAFKLKEIIEDVPLMAVIPHEMSPIGGRLIKKDIVLISLMILLLLGAYVGFAVIYKLGVF